MAEEKPATIRRTVSFDPFVERAIRQNEAEMLKLGWRNANFSLALNVLILAVYFDHATDSDVFHAQTTKQIKRWLDGKLRLDEKDMQKWDRWIEKSMEKVARLSE